MTCVCTLPDLQRHVFALHLTYDNVFVTKLSLRYLKRCTHDFNLQLLLTIQHLTYKTVSKNIVLTEAMDCETWSLQKGVPLCNFDLQDLIACKFSHRCSISTTMFPHKRVVYDTCSCACSQNKRRVSAHFLTYENMLTCKI